MSPTFRHLLTPVVVPLQLTCLALDFRPGAPPRRADAAAMAPAEAAAEAGIGEADEYDDAGVTILGDLASLAPLTGLVAVRLDNAVIEEEGICLLASLPNLGALRVGELRPGVDLSDMAAPWTYLRMRESTSPVHIVYLPRRADMVLVVDGGDSDLCSTPARFALQWGAFAEVPCWPPVTAADADAAYRQVTYDAAEVLMAGVAHEEFWPIGLEFLGAFPLSDAVGDADAYLSSLTPFASNAGFHLRLRGPWGITRARVAVLAASLTRLGRLEVGLDEVPGWWGFPSLAAGVCHLGLALPELWGLHIHGNPPPGEDVPPMDFALGYLRKLFRGRRRSGNSLVVSLGSREHVDAHNAAVESMFGREDARPLGYVHLEGDDEQWVYFEFVEEDE